MFVWFLGDKSSNFSPTAILSSIEDMKENTPRSNSSNATNSGVSLLNLASLRYSKVVAAI